MREIKFERPIIRVKDRDIFPNRLLELRSNATKDTRSYDQIANVEYMIFLLLLAVTCTLDKIRFMVANL